MCRRFDPGSAHEMELPVLQVVPFSFCDLSSQPTAASESQLPTFLPTFEGRKAVQNGSSRHCQVGLSQGEPTPLQDGGDGAGKGRPAQEEGLVLRPGGRGSGGGGGDVAEGPLEGAAGRRKACLGRRPFL